MSNIKRAIIVAAGIGKRLQPITLETPKPLISVNGKRIIDRSIEALFANGVEDIYIVTGYKKEQFEKAFESDPRIHVLFNENYLKGNNITSMYVAKDFLPGAFVLEGDIVINDPSIFSGAVENSGYMASWKDNAVEWILDVEDGKIKGCQISGQAAAYQLWGISMWTEEDGKRLAELIESEYTGGNRDTYWDELALDKYKDRFDLRIREIPADALAEIDTVAELAAIDASYKKYTEGKD